MATPKVSRQLFDNNLTRAAAGGSGPRNRRVVILGNATDGPLNAPVKVSSPSDAAELFGPFGSGAYNLTRGLKECFDGQSAGTAAPDVYGLRVVGYTDATTPQSLAAHRTWASDSTGSDVFKLEAVHPGTLYNDISIWANATELYIYNPKTKLNTKITWTGLDISDLASLINADISLNEIMFASSIVGDQLISEEIHEHLAIGQFGIFCEFCLMRGGWNLDRLFFLRRFGVSVFPSYTSSKISNFDILFSYVTCLENS